MSSENRERYTAGVERVAGIPKKQTGLVQNDVSVPHDPHLTVSSIGNDRVGEEKPAKWSRDDGFIRNEDRRVVDPKPVAVQGNDQSQPEEHNEARIPETVKQKPGTQEPPSFREVLKFTKKTALNFFHFHKTGGVSFKAALHNFYQDKFKADGGPVVYRDACYIRDGVPDDPSQPTFVLWRCDWAPIRAMDEENRNKHDLIFGHQFGGNGAKELLNKRDLRTFTVLRHPFDRKVSFFYHFFVREIQRNESEVTFEEIRNFLLYDKLIVKANLGRDLGPNYVAGRLLSDGFDGFVGNSSFKFYNVIQEQKQEVAEKALEIIREYVFVGLQTQTPASKCMLRKVMEVFNEVHGIGNQGIEKIDQSVALNRGSYTLSAADIWSMFSTEDRILFDRRERVDIMLYDEGERLFRNQVRLFGCEDRLQVV